ncbi:unnamed protein product [Ilex paraguariensis]|uniref:Prolamin-like domain-containing protein n=1 Tax=Ilex paraguariensis TaxID=185542 RepID=A0ABC8SZI0_9AQUA
MALKWAFLLLTITCFIANSTSARELLPGQQGFDLKARPEANGNLVECLSALKEIKSCSDEIVIFFTNGTTDIGPPCCQAVKMITHQCWPAMLTALGFTQDECYILRGYCDAASGPAPSLSLQLPAKKNGKA